MTMTMKSTTLLAVSAFVLAGCSSMNVFKDDASAPPPQAEAVEAQAPPPLEPAENAMSAAAINKKLSGKSWKWQGKEFSGVTLYANDGSSLVEITGKGTTTGKWVAKDGQLCEKLEPAPFLPATLPITQKMTCAKVADAGSNLRVGGGTFTLAQ
jgi:Protein of unknown function (DUF995)